MPTSFEIHASPVATMEYRHSLVPADEAIFAVPDHGEPAWICVDKANGQLLPADPGSALAGLLVVARRLGQGLAMFARDADILVNGLPAVPCSVLTTRDAITFAPGLLHYVTERFKPFIGPPSEDMLKQKRTCPCCQLPFEPASRVIPCYCGQPYHWESTESHPDKSGRLDCFERVRKCLSPNCGRAMTRGEETLTWDPRDL